MPEMAQPFIFAQSARTSGSPSSQAFSMARACSSAEGSVFAHSAYFT